MSMKVESTIEGLRIVKRNIEQMHDAEREKLKGYVDGAIELIIEQDDKIRQLRYTSKKQ